MKGKLLTTREASYILEIPEKDIIELAQTNFIPHFKVAGEFLRFERAEILKIKKAIKKKYHLPERKYRRRERIREFFYFHDFYIICAGIIIFLLWIIFKDFF